MSQPVNDKFQRSLFNGFTFTSAQIQYKKGQIFHRLAKIKPLKQVRVN